MFGVIINRVADKYIVTYTCSEMQYYCNIISNIWRELLKDLVV